MALDLDDTNVDELEDRGDSFDPYEDDDKEDELEEDTNEDESEDEEEDGEDDSDSDDEEEEIAPKKESKIPKSRLDEVISQREAALDRSLWLEEQLEKLIAAQTRSQEAPAAPKVETPQYDFAAAEEQYISLIIEGEISKASALRATIDKERKNEMLSIISTIEESAKNKATETSTVAIENQKFSLLIENFENKYKFLDSKADEYNEEAVDTVNTLLAGYVASGKTKSEGLALAVKKVAPMYEKVVTEPKKTSLGQKRTEQAGRKAAQAAKAIPPKSKSSLPSDTDSKNVSIAKLSDRDFRKLTVAEKKLLRGD